MSKKPQKPVLLKQGPHLPEQYEGTHRGILAALSGKDREETIADELSQRMRNAGFSSYAAHVENAIHRCPRLSLPETIQLFSRNTLLILAKAFGLKGYSKLRKAELCAMIVGRIMTIAPEIMETLLISGPDTFRAFIERLAKAGGSITVTAADLDRIDRDTESLRLPGPQPPFINLYCYDSVFTYVLPKELALAYEEIDQTSIDRERRQQELLLKSAKVSTELYGLISLIDFLNWLLQNDEYDLGVSESLSLLSSYIDSGGADFDFYDSEGESAEEDGLYLAHISLLEGIFYDDDEEASEEDLAGLAEYRRNLIVYHDMVERRPLDVTEVLSLDPFDMFLELSSVARLQGLLDTFIPDGEDDYLYADSVLSALYRFARMSIDKDIICDFLEDTGLPRGLITSNVFSKILTEVLDNTPQWLAHGWSIVEYEEQGQRERGSAHIRSARNYSSHLNHDHPDNHPPLQVIEGGLCDGQWDTQQKKPGRNEPCPCGSGKKYKNCCGKS